MKERVVEPEILDELSGDDPRALRSRRDLRLINALMGNERWILRQLEKRSSACRVAELGAGRGELLSRISQKGFAAIGLDLQPPPERLVTEAEWATGDLFQTLPKSSPQIVVGSLILHHFQDEELLRLGRLLVDCEQLIFAEPYRSSFASLEGYTLFPIINDVTKHDMQTSIRAGFRRGELAIKLGLGEEWHWEERVTLRGGLRMIAKRTQNSDNEGEIV